MVKLKKSFLLILIALALSFSDRLSSADDSKEVYPIINDHGSILKGRVIKETAEYFKINFDSEIGSTLITFISENPYKGKEAGTYFENGIEDIKRGNLAEAIEYFTKAVNAEPNFANAYYDLGMAMFNNSLSTDTVIKYFEKSLELKPDFAEAVCYIGALRGMLGEYDLGIKYLQRSLSLNPELDEAYDYLAGLYSVNNQMAKAAEIYKMVLERNPENMTAYVTLGAYSLNEGHKEKAKEYLKKAIAISEKKGNSAVSAKLRKTLEGIQ